MRIIVLLLFINSFAIYGKSWDEYHIDRYDSNIIELYNSKEINGAVLIGSSERILYKKAYGFVDLNRSSPINYDTSFRLASVSKVFTGLAIMILHEKYNLNYDSLVKSYIQEFPYNDVTVRHLLTHTSGLSDYTEIFDPDLEDFSKVLKNQDVIDELITSSRALYFTPGDRYEYNNSNYVLLSEIIHRVSGYCYEDFLKEYIFNPLSMKNTRVFNLISANKSFENRAKGYKGQIELIHSWLDGVSGDGAVFSSINDLHIFYKGLKEYRVVSKETFIEGATPHILNNGRLSDYGFGMAILNDGSLQHGGGWLGARTFFQFNLEKDEVVIALDSCSSDKLWNIVAYEGVKLLRYLNF